MSTQKLLNVLTRPNKIALSLDWRKFSGSVLTLGIHQDRIGLAIATHPSDRQPAFVFEDLPLSKRGQVTPDSLDRLASIVRENRVCGFVVSWPIQSDTGRMGAACGRVLHTLDDLVSKSDIVNAKRPMCLWDGAHVQPEPEDRWGRCAAYARTTTKTEHRASVEQYHEDEKMDEATIWNDFCQVHWPKLQEVGDSNKSIPIIAAKSTSVPDSNWEEAASSTNHNKAHA